MAFSVDENLTVSHRQVWERAYPTDSIYQRIPFLLRQYILETFLADALPRFMCPSRVQMSAHAFSLLIYCGGVRED